MRLRSTGTSPSRFRLPAATTPGAYPKMTTDQAVTLIAAGGAVELISAVVMAVIYHRLGLKTLEQELAFQRAAFERQLEQERQLFARELPAGRDLVKQPLEAQREELLLDRLSKSPTDEQRNEIMAMQWARDISRGLHLKQQDGAEE